MYPSISNTKGRWPKLAMMWSSFFLRPTMGYSFPLTSLKGMSLNAMPALCQPCTLTRAEEDSTHPTPGHSW